MQYPRVVGAYPAAGQFLRADLATIILYSKERVGNYPAVMYGVLMFRGGERKQSTYLPERLYSI